jgi:hypothetical protein
MSIEKAMVEKLWGVGDGRKPDGEGSMRGGGGKIR